MTQPPAIRQDVFFQDICQDVRRRRDGSIDVDFYRADAIALRNRAIRDTFRLMAFAKVRMPFKRLRMRLALLANGPPTRWFRQAPRPRRHESYALLTGEYVRGRKDPRGYDAQPAGFGASKSSHDGL
jgi:hypothetical protein